MENGRHIPFYCDKSVVHVVNTKQSRIARVMDLVCTWHFLPCNTIFTWRQSTQKVKRMRLHHSTICRVSSLSSAIHTPGNLNEEISHNLGLSMAASTKQTYTSAEKRFLDFCHLYQPSVGTGQFLSVDENTLFRYAAYLARLIKYSSIKSYLASVPSAHPEWLRVGSQKIFPPTANLQMY